MRHLGPRRWTPAEGRPALPTFVVIGAAKCGTTSLHRYLGAHPEIHMAPAKEVKFFHRPTCLDELDSYATFFDATATQRGESSPVYACHPLAPGVPERMHAAIPNAKLIYVVRDPVERVVADYVQEYGQERESRPFAEAVGDVADPYNRYVAAGEYSTQLSHYLRRFSIESVFVVDGHRLLGDRERVLREIFGFLGVDPELTSPAFAAMLNTRDTKLRWTPIGRSLVRSGAAEAVRMLPSRARKTVFSPVKRLVTRPLESPRLEPDLRHRLQEHFRPELDQLRALTGLSLDGWPPWAIRRS
jgi:hypothetical protein